MRIRALLIVGNVVSIAAAVLVGGSLYLTFQDAKEALSKTQAANTIARPVVELMVLTGDYLLHPGKRDRIQWEQRHESLSRLLAEMQRVDPDESGAFNRIRSGKDEIKEIFARLVAIDASARASADESIRNKALRERLIAQLRIISLSMALRAFELSSESHLKMEAAITRAAWIVIFLIAAILGAIVVIWIVFASRIVAPLSTLEQGIKTFGAGDLDYRIDPQSNDEIGEIATTANEMARTLKETTVSRDELRKAHKELEAVNQELQAFSYSVSHDLRAPLRGMDGFSHALLEDYGDKLDAEGRDYLQRVRAASQRMAQLIDDLLKLSRVTRGKTEHRKIDLSKLAQAVAAELQERAPERQVTFDIAPGVTAEGDARMIRIALENLMGNAWKFTAKHDHATIEFGIANDGRQPAYFVRDDGAGFDMAYADKLFQPFQRLHSGAEFGGTGIGLATVARIVQRHGGRVWAESGVEQGTTVYFTL